MDGALFWAALSEPCDRVDELLSSWVSQSSDRAPEVLNWKGIELAVLVSRRAVRAGASRNAVESLNGQLFPEILGARDPSVLTVALKEYLESVVSACDSSGESRRLERAVRIREFIESHCDEPLTLDAMSKRFFLSKSALGLLVRRGTGMGFKEHQIRCRIRRAKALLMESTRSVEEVAKALGFRDASHFCRTFRRLEGCTPSEFRQEAVPSATCHTPME